jgi:hypothetical protein
MAKGTDMSLEDIKSVAAVDGHYIRMKRGQLGLQKIGALQSAVNAAAHTAIQRTFKVAGYLDKSRNRTAPDSGH